MVANDSVTSSRSFEIVLDVKGLDIHNWGKHDIAIHMTIELQDLKLLENGGGEPEASS